jgi:hypothetical protein
MSDLGPLSYFLRIEVSSTSDGIVPRKVHSRSSGSLLPH